MWFNLNIYLFIYSFTVLDANNCVVSSTATTTTNNTNSNNNTTSTTCSTKNTGTSEAHIPPLLGVAPLGPAQLTVEHELQFKMLQAAFFHMPHPSDSERLRLHLPRQPCQTPVYYPQVSFGWHHTMVLGSAFYMYNSTQYILLYLLCYSRNLFSNNILLSYTRIDIYLLILNIYANINCE